MEGEENKQWKRGDKIWGEGVNRLGQRSSWLRISKCMSEKRWRKILEEDFRAENKKGQVEGCGRPSSWLVFIWSVFCADRISVNTSPCLSDWCQLSSSILGTTPQCSQEHQRDSTVFQDNDDYMVFCDQSWLPLEYSGLRCLWNLTKVIPSPVMFCTSQFPFLLPCLLSIYPLSKLVSGTCSPPTLQLDDISTALATTQVKSYVFQVL